MQHREEIGGITAAALFRELTSKEFLTAFGDEVGVTTNSMDLSVDGKARKAVLGWSFHTDKPGIPTLARKFLSDEVELTWDQTWQPAGTGAYDGKLVVTLAGRPSAESNGTSQVLAIADGAALLTDTTTKTSLPRLVAGGIESTIDKELVGWIISVQARVLRRRLAK